MPDLSKTKNYKDIAGVQRDNVHGWHSKIGAVIHETVSPNYPGWGDIISVSQYLDNKDYGIHGIVDNEGHIGWAMGLGKAIFYHTSSTGTKGQGAANSNFVGIELVSSVPMLGSRAARIKAWAAMNPEINAAAKLLACLSRTHGFPLSDNPGNTRLPGVTTHWEVSHYYNVPHGHWDCWPQHRGGHFPKRLLIQRAKVYKAAGWHF